MPTNKKKVVSQVISIDPIHLTKEQSILIYNWLCMENEKNPGFISQLSYKSCALDNIQLTAPEPLTIHFSSSLELRLSKKATAPFTIQDCRFDIHSKKEIAKGGMSQIEKVAGVLAPHPTGFFYFKNHKKRVFKIQHQGNPNCFEAQRESARYEIENSEKAKYFSEKIIHIFNARRELVPHQTICFSMAYLTGKNLYQTPFYQFCNKKSMARYLSVLSREHYTVILNKRLLRIMRELSRIHREQRIVHRDIKPENIMISPLGKVTLIDFGLSTKINTLTTLSGTAGYFSPELISPCEAIPAHDFYSFGVICLEIFLQTKTRLKKNAAGKVDLRDEPWKEIIKEISVNPEWYVTKIQENFAYSTEQCAMLLSLCARLLSPASQRPSDAEIISVLEAIDIDFLSEQQPTDAIRTAYETGKKVRQLLDASSRNTIKPNDLTTFRTLLFTYLDTLAYQESPFIIRAFLTGLDVIELLSCQTYADILALLDKLEKEYDILITQSRILYTTLCESEGPEAPLTLQIQTIFWDLANNKEKLHYFLEPDALIKFITEKWGMLCPGQKNDRPIIEEETHLSSSKITRSSQLLYQPVYPIRNTFIGDEPPPARKPKLSFRKKHPILFKIGVGALVGALISSSLIGLSVLIGLTLPLVIPATLLIASGISFFTVCGGILGGCCACKTAENTSRSIQMDPILEQESAPKPGTTARLVQQGFHPHPGVSSVIQPVLPSSHANTAILPAAPSPGTVLASSPGMKAK